MKTCIIMIEKNDKTNDNAEMMIWLIFMLQASYLYNIQLQCGVP